MVPVMVGNVHFIGESGRKKDNSLIQGLSVKSLPPMTNNDVLHVLKNNCGFFYRKMWYQICHFYLYTFGCDLIFNYHVKEARATKVLSCIEVVKSLPLFTSKIN